MLLINTQTTSRWQHKKNKKSKPLKVNYRYTKSQFLFTKLQNHLTQRSKESSIPVITKYKAVNDTEKTHKEVLSDKTQALKRKKLGSDDYDAVVKKQIKKEVGVHLDFAVKIKSDE